MSFLHTIGLVIFIAFAPEPQDASFVHLPTKFPSTTPFPPAPRTLPSIDEILHDGKDHPCYRQCNGTAMTCYYHFKMEWYQSMSKACYNCPFNATDCDRHDCVVANGISRSMTAVNRKMPGPAVEVCQNDKIVVDVANDLMASGTTIHWHGLYQKDHPFMDGAPFVTQCPIQPSSTFRYEFVALQAGTYFWHSHIGLQRADGVTGSLIVRTAKSQDAHGNLYDFDISEHTVLVTDWSDRLAVAMFTNQYHAAGSNRPSALLINGKGRFEVTNGTTSVFTKPAKFDVAKGSRYRFRLINAEFLNCPVELSVDGHNITVIATDGSDLEPVTATKLVTYSGERYDFIINADQKVDNYWIRIRGLLACASEPNPVRQVGILHYEGASESEPSQLQWNPRNGLEINAVNQAEEQNVSIPVSRLKTLLAPDDCLKPVPDYKFYISYDLYAKNNSNFNKYPFYGYDQVRDVNPAFASRTPQLNHISMKLPTSPLLYTRPSESLFCNQSTVRKSCEQEYCQCPHVMKVKLDSVVELIIIDEGSPFDTNHPFHLHGYSFRVLGQRRLDNRTTLDKVKAFENAGMMTRNLRNPPSKDTVTVPDGGYTIVRFKANNPGYWLFHCHIEFHAEVGMALVFKVGEHEDMVPVPSDFPTCGDFRNIRNGGFKSSGASVIKNTGYKFSTKIVYRLS